MWQQEAACQGADVNLFILVDLDHPEGLLRDVNARKALTVSNFEKAGELCDGCPVRAACLESASEEDLEWTFRAGLYPKRFSAVKAGRPRGDAREGETGKFKGCKAHDNKGSDGRCLTCKTESRRKWRAANAARMVGES